MQTSKEQNFERELPPRYRLALYINAKQVKLGLIFTLVSLAVLALVMAVAVLPLYLSGNLSREIFRVGQAEWNVTYLIFIATMILYIILHEWGHGIAYKALTGEKLTFGISWSCAFCGVPHIFTYRRAAIIAVITPFAFFTALFVPLLVLFYCLNPLYYLLASFIFGLHLGGCCGDLYVLYLFAVRFKNPKTLMRDTGPEQYFYVPSEDGAPTSDQ